MFFCCRLFRAWCIIALITAIKRRESVKKAMPFDVGLSYVYRRLHTRSTTAATHCSPGVYFTARSRPSGVLSARTYRDIATSSLPRRSSLDVTRSIITNTPYLSPIYVYFSWVGPSTICNAPCRKVIGLPLNVFLSGLLLFATDSRSSDSRFHAFV